jgi:hypothetical protein
MQNIHIGDVEGKPAVCFDSGLDPRSFARTKMSQSLIENGYIVYPNGSHEIWKASGVSEVNGQMRIWGPPFAGKRLDMLIDEVNSTTPLLGTAQTAAQASLQAVVFWIRAKMLLGDANTSLNPGAAFVCLQDGQACPKGSVFFAPVNLANRCLIVEGTKNSTELPGVSEKKRSSNKPDVPVLDRYGCPDLIGMEAVAFCAGTMLYRILAKSHSYFNDTTIFQDMREGIFLPPHLAAPGLDKKLCDLIQSAFLLPVEKKRTGMSGTDIIGNLLRALMENENHIIPVSSLFTQLSQEERARLEEEKKRHLKIQNTFVKTKRFVIRNKHALIGTVAGLLFVLFIIASMTKSASQRPTTAGMAPDTVIVAYYDAFSSLDHVFMEACVQGAGKDDINTAANLFAIGKTRQAYEMSTRSTFISARVWRESGGELPAPDVFGVTDLSIEYLAGSEEDGMIIYRAGYLLWSPEGYSISRDDILTLRRDRRKNWRITEILRNEF